MEIFYRKLVGALKLKNTNLYAEINLMKKTNAKPITKTTGARAFVPVLPPPQISGLIDPVAYPGLISREEADKAELIVNIPVWTPRSNNPNQLDTLDHFLDGQLVSSEPIFFTEPAPGTYPVTIRRRSLTDGDHTVSYTVTHRGNPSDSFEAPLVIDRDAPYDSIPDGPRRLTLPPGWTGSITQALLDANAGVVPFGIPAYDAEGAHPGDRWRLYYGQSLEVINEGPVFPNREALFTQAMADAADGPRPLVYRLVDVAGNISSESFELPVNVALKPAPTLTSPGVRDALSLTGVGDRLFDRADAAASSGMFVIIPNYDADRTLDQLVVRLTTLHGSRDVGPYPLGSSPLPFNFAVDFPTCLALYGTSNGPINLRVEYAVVRGGTFYWVPTPTNIEIELEVGGPTNPWDPEPTNPNLPLPVLTGRGSGKVNELDKDDDQQSADVVVTLWSATPLPSADPFDVVLYYQNEVVDRKSVDNTTAMPGDEVHMEVPWPFIQKHSNNLIPLRYEIALSTTHNRTSSPIQDINVNANVISFAPPRVKDAAAGVPAEIWCSTLQGPNREVHVFVPPHDLLREGMIVLVNWTGCSDNDGAVPIPSATRSFPSLPLTFEDTRVGFHVTVGPYATYVKPINEAAVDMGSVNITYTVPVIGLPTPVTSAEAILLVGGVRPGPVYCDNTPWPSGI
ncbi:hypothetical protein [Pseudomonas salmasensis]|uniref:hypothetical protein n=1 Tax=Pseudomonas salmasensis TaxID=2745514 RepID=UPI0016483E97|nr:hypothetical protein [Pseudomonas salmasensis]QXH78845.1 hypothetical protein HU731_003175 [Pseudomonas salmasensis]